MKGYTKQIFVMILCLTIVFSAVACVGGSYVPGTGGTQSGNNGNGNLPGGDSESGYTFTVTLTDSLHTQFNAAELRTLKAIWTDTESNNNASYSAYFDSEGVATISGLDGDFRVTLSSPPDGYTYNPNIYTVNNLNRDVEINLYQLQTITNNGTGTGWYGSEVCQIDTEGAYRAELTKKNFEDGIRFKFVPNYAGKYSIESLMDITANKINPYLDMYRGTIAYVNTDFPETTNGGGEENTYTKNFRWEFELDDNSRGNVWLFRIYATALDKDMFPLYVDFIVERDGNITGGENPYKMTEVNATHDFEGAKDTAFNDATGTFVYFAEYLQIAGLSDDDKTLDGTKVGLNTDDGYYHMLDADGKPTGKKLYAMIAKDCKVIITETKLGFMSADVSLRFIEGREKADGTIGDTVSYYNYTKFIRDQYGAYDEVENKYKYLNGDGVYPVTEELRLFLYRYSTTQRFFNDGDGIAESTYSSTQKNQWLFACGVYN